jgi:hypothetical protein
MGACPTCSDARLRLVMTLACALPILVRDPRGDANEPNLSQLAPATSSARRAHPPRPEAESRKNPRPPAAASGCCKSGVSSLLDIRVVDQVAYHANWAAEVGLEHRLQIPAVVAHRPIRPAAVPNGSPFKLAARQPREELSDLRGVRATRMLRQNCRRQRDDIRVEHAGELTRQLNRQPGASHPWSALRVL